MRIAFVHNVCTYYTQKTLELFAGYYDVDYYFHSTGDEWYWQKEHGIQTGDFQHEYLWGFKIGRTRITPTLIFKLWRIKYNIYLCSIAGRFALPMTYLIARIKRKPFILWTGIWQRLMSRYHRLLFPVVRYIYRHADAVVVYGSHVKRYLQSEGVKADNIFIANHAIDNTNYNYLVPEAEKRALRKGLNIKEGQKVILYLGRLEEVKGLHYLIEAFTSLKPKDTVLVIAGTGSQRSFLEQLAKEKGIADKVRFPGYVPQVECVAYYANAWVYVLPSITTSVSKELWGLVVNEAFNQGVPVITTEAVGAAAGGLVQDGINGFIVPEKNSKELADAIKKILKDDELHAQLSQNAREIISEWTQERMVEGFKQAIEYVTNQWIRKNSSHSIPQE